MKCSLYITARHQQEAQLSHRDRAMLRATEYFTKLLKVAEGHF